MKKNLLTAVLMTLVTTVLFGLLFPLLITGLAQIGVAYNPSLVYAPEDLDLYGSGLLEQGKAEQAYKVYEKIANDYPIPAGMRPAQATPLMNLFLAGDWTATNWPATMEGAVRSGYLAAEALLGQCVVRSGSVSDGGSKPDKSYEPEA